MFGRDRKSAAPVAEVDPAIAEAGGVPPVAVVEEEKSHRGRNAVVVVAALAITGGLIAWGVSGEDKPDDNHVPAAAEAGDNCKKVEFKNSAADPDHFAAESFFPRAGKLKTTADVKSYTGRLFNDNGPLAAQADLWSIAGAWATFGAPSHDGVATNADYSYLKTAADTAAVYQAGGEKQAAKDCADLYDTINQLAGLNPNWAQAGETVTKVIALRDTKNPDESKRFNIIGYKLDPNHVTTATLGGIEIVLNESSRDLDGFNSVLIDEEGAMYLKGISESGSVGLEGDTPAEGTPQLNPVPGAENPFAGGTQGQVETINGNEVTKGTNANGDQVTVIRNPITGDTQVITTPVAGGPPTVAVVPTNPGNLPPATGTTPTTPDTAPPATGTVPTPTTPGVTVTMPTTTVPRGVTTTSTPVSIPPTTVKTTTTLPPTTVKPTTTTTPPTTVKPTTTTTSPPVTIKPPKDCDPVIDDCTPAQAKAIATASSELQDTSIAYSSPSSASAKAVLSLAMAKK